MNRCTKNAGDALGNSAWTDRMTGWRHERENRVQRAKH
jgi:hypothetical protein